MRTEGLGDVLPDTPVVEHLHRLSGPLRVVDLVGVAHEDLRQLLADGSLADALDLDHHVLVICEHRDDQSVGIAVDQVVDVHEWHLLVRQRAARCTAVRAVLRRDREPPVLARLALPSAEQPAHPLEAALPLAVVLVPLLEDVFELEVMRGTLRDLAFAGEQDAQVRRPRAPVGLRHLRRVDDVLPAIVWGLVLALQQPLAVGEQVVVVLPGVAEAGQLAGWLLPTPPVGSSYPCHDAPCSE